jgi:hypothetical protein
LTKRATTEKDTDLLGEQRGKTAASRTDAGTLSSDVPAEPFNMRRRISSTTYEVTAYFNPESKETMDDKILRLVRIDTISENDKTKLKRTI